MVDIIETDNQPWQMANGKPKPEFKLALKTPLSDGTKELFLTEPNVKTIRRATKLLEFDYTAPPDAEGNRPPKPDSAMAYGTALIAGSANLSDDLIEELPLTLFTMATEYLSSFTPAR